MNEQTAIPVEPAFICERCLRRPSVHTHHRNRDRNDNRPENLRRCCLFCHAWIHDKVAEAYETGWLVHSWDDVTTIESIPLKPDEHVLDADAAHAGLAPGETCPVCHRRVPKPKDEQEAPRQKATISMKVPQDQRENGVELWYEMIQIGRDMLCERMGWEPNVPMYNVAMVLVAQGLEVARQDAFMSEELADA